MLSLKAGRNGGQTARTRHAWQTTLLLLAFLLFLGCTHQTPRQTNTSGDNAVAWQPNPTLVEQEIHAKINEQRIQNNLSPLVWDELLAQIARAHSEDMAQNDYFDHASAQGFMPSDRAALANYTCIKNVSGGQTEGIGENIFKGAPWRSIEYVNDVEVSRDWKTQANFTDEVVKDWMGSPEHRENILDQNYDREGMGAAISSDGQILVSEDFC